MQRLATDRETAALAGRAELVALRRRIAGLFLPTVVFSALVNLLGLTGSIYMLQVYDRVIPSQSVPTLVALSVLGVVLYLAMGFLDHLRGRILARAGVRFQAWLDPRVFRLTVTRSRQPGIGNPAAALQDVEAIQRFLSGPMPIALMDAPWLPLYVILLFWIHWSLGLAALVAALILTGLAFWNERGTRDIQDDVRSSALEAAALESGMRQDVDALQALGMRGHALARWQAVRGRLLAAQLRHSDVGGRFSVTSKTFRSFIQSAMLGLGALLVIDGLMSAGTIIATSILLGRALQPIEVAISQWAQLTRAREGWKNLSELMGANPPVAPAVELPAPRGNLSVQGVVAVPPGSATPSLRGISFTLVPGQAMGVIGPSASGKTTLAKIVTGTWPVAAGSVRLDGATYDQWDADRLGAHLGYLPQEISLFSGTVAENIARLGRRPGDDPDIVAAAQAAGAHEMILGLPQGYDTPVGQGGLHLSGGQRQRVALARALYRMPALIVLDEPNAHLDSEGEIALQNAILSARQQGSTVIVMAHRPSAINACDQLLVLDRGMQRQFGPRDEVLREVVRAVPQTAPHLSAGGLT